MHPYRSLASRPILFSFRRCPYAISARLALAYCCIEYQTIEVNFKNKPKALSLLSPKATVPVLFLPDTKQVIDESIDVVHWAIASALDYPSMTLASAHYTLELTKPCFIENNEYATIMNTRTVFIEQLNQLKFAKFSSQEEENTMLHAQIDLLTQWESIIGLHAPQYLLHAFSSLDILLLPTIRQWYRTPYGVSLESCPKLFRWLQWHMQSSIWQAVMKKPDAEQLTTSKALAEHVYACIASTH